MTKLGNAVRQVLEYLNMRDEVKVFLASPLIDEESIRILDFIVAEGDKIKGEITTSRKRPIRFELIYRDHESCERAWRKLSEAKSKMKSSGGNHFTFDEHDTLKKPKIKKFQKTWDEVDIPSLILKLHAETDVTVLISKTLFNRVLLESPQIKSFSTEKRQRFKQHLVGMGLIEVILHGARVAGYRLKDVDASPRHKSGVFRLEDARIETILGIFASSDFARYLRMAKGFAVGEKIKMRTLVRLSKEHLGMPADLTRATWYDTIMIKALLESGYFERVAALAGYLQFSLNAYDLMELGNETSMSRPESE